MARVRFLADFDYDVTRNVTIAYKAGAEETVKRECADKAIAAGKAEELEPLPARSENVDGDAK